MRIEERGTTRPDRDPDPDPEDASNSLLRSSRCCFVFPCLGSRRRASSDAAAGAGAGSGSGLWEKIRHEDRWWSRAALKLREWSELVAGPRWKTFIRRFNRRHGGGGDRDRHHGHGHGQFQYDSLSYALNFDEGPVVEDSGDVAVADEDRLYGGFRSFSTRYAAAVPPWSKKTVAGAGGGGDGGGGGSTEAGRLVT